MEKVFFSPIPEDELFKRFREMIRAELDADASKKQAEQLLSPAETCKLFNPAISKVTLAKWTDEGRLKRYDIGGRVYYRQSEVIEAAKNYKRYQR